MQIRPEFLPAVLLFVLCIAANIVLYPSVGSMVSGTPAAEDNSVKRFQFSLPLDKYFPHNSQTDKEPDAKPAEQHTKTAEKTLADRDPFAKFLSADEIQGKAAAAVNDKLPENKPADNKPAGNKSDAELKLYDKNTEKGHKKEPETAVLPSLTVLPPQSPQPLYANQAGRNEIEKTNFSKALPENIVSEKTGIVRKLPEWETVDSVLNKPVMYDTPSEVIPFPSVDCERK